MAGPRTSRTKRGSSGLLLALALAVAALTLAGCGARRAVRATRVAVTVARVERRDVPLQVATTGTVEPIQSASVGSQVGGVIESIAFREGQDVATGTVLIQLDPRPFRATLAQAEGQLGKDRAQWQVARQNAERSTALTQQQLIAPAEDEQTQATAQSGHAVVRADSANVISARLNLEYASIRAPISGRTGNLNVHVGDLVKAGTSDPLVTINQIQPIRVRFTLPQDQLPLVQRYRNANPRVFVRAAGDSAGEQEGRLVFLDNAVDPTTGTVMLKGEFPNKDGVLWPGEMVQVRLVLTVQTNAVVVPSPAVTTGPQGPYVYVMNADSTATARPVRVDRSDDVTAVIAGGLRPGETVVTDGQFRISPGSRLVVRKAGRGSQS